MSDNPTWPDLNQCEAPLDKRKEVQWRQVHPNFVDRGVVARDAFVGTPDATGEVSTVRSATRSAEDAYTFHTVALALSSAGSWGVTVAEADQTGCRCVDDVECEGVDTPGHSYVDMRGLAKASRKVARTELAAVATARGCQHP